MIDSLLIILRWRSYLLLFCLSIIYFMRNPVKIFVPFCCLVHLNTSPDGIQFVFVSSVLIGSSMTCSLSYFCLLNNIFLCIFPFLFSYNECQFNSVWMWSIVFPSSVNKIECKRKEMNDRNVQRKQLFTTIYGVFVQDLHLFL